MGVFSGETHDPFAAGLTERGIGSKPGGVRYQFGRAEKNAKLSLFLLALTLARSSKASLGAPDFGGEWKTPVSISLSRRMSRALAEIFEPFFELLSGQPLHFGLGYTGRWPEPS